jgi:hypothetical protein
MHSIPARLIRKLGRDITDKSVRAGYTIRVLNEALFHCASCLVKRRALRGR